MYIVNDKLPKDCFECKFRTKCDVWESFLRLPLNMAEIEIEDLKYLRPMVFRNCKLRKIPPFISRFYIKFIKKKCQHLCILCEHKNHCELYTFGKE